MAKEFTSTSEYSGIVSKITLFNRGMHEDSAVACEIKDFFMGAVHTRWMLQNYHQPAETNPLRMAAFICLMFGLQSWNIYCRFASYFLHTNRRTSIWLLNMQ